MARRGSSGRWALVPVVALAAGGVACSGGDGGRDDVVIGPVEFEPTAEFLSAASRRSSESAYRIDMTMTWDAAHDGDEFSIDAPFMTGDLIGERYAYVVDMEDFLDQMAAEEGESAPVLDDYTLSVVGDDETLYLRAPVYAAVAEARPGRDLGARGELAVLGDRWGRVDLRTLDDVSLAKLQQLLGVSTSSSELDPRILLDLVSHADDVEELGTDEVDGVGVNGLAADVPMTDMLEANGTDPEDYSEQVMAEGDESGLDADTRTAIVERTLDYEMPCEVWVDGEGYVRRITVEVDMTEIMGWVRAQAMGMDEFTIGGTIDYSAYGDEGIAVEFPADAIDATEIVGRALEEGP